jgi:glycosyltransferase involved in cell wall biosynthesis
VEAFGRNILEAMASGLPAILPPHFRPLFGDAAVYAEPVEVPSVLRRLYADRVAYEEIVARAAGEAADSEARQALQKAAGAGDVSWLGFVRSEDALARVSGSLAGLCLLRDLPNYRISLPTKIVEYGALGVPVITTPLPLASDLVRSEHIGFEVQISDRCGVLGSRNRVKWPKSRHWSEF